MSTKEIDLRPTRAGLAVTKRVTDKSVCGRRSMSLLAGLLLSVSL